MRGKRDHQSRALRFHRFSPPLPLSPLLVSRTSFPPPLSLSPPAGNGRPLGARQEQKRARKMFALQMHIPHVGKRKALNAREREGMKFGIG